MAKKNETKEVPTSTNTVRVLSEDDKIIIEKLKDPGECKNLLHDCLRLPNSAETGYEKGVKLLIRKLEGEELSEEEKKQLGDIVVGTNITKNHRMLAEVVINNTDRMAMTEMADDLIKEYDCKTVSERSLCEIVVNSYAQILKINKKMTSTMHAGEYLSHDRNTYISVLSKELERANRNYLSALHALREIKSPSLNIHIKTKTAIIGTNQQFNTNLPPDEIIAR